ERMSYGFYFPNDRGGKLLADLLPPSAKQERLPSDVPAKPITFPIPRFLERGEMPLPPGEATLPNTNLGVKSRLIRPRSVYEEVPLATYRGEPRPPYRLVLLAGGRVREWS